MQRPQPVQIICICPDICAFSVLHHRHLSDICAFCQKCQFEVKKGWQVLLLQSKAEDMHYKQADSAILKLLLVQASMRRMYFISKQTYVVITCFCRNMGYVAFTRILSQIAFCHEYALFWFCFVQTLLRHLGFDSDFAQISAQKIGGWGLCLSVQQFSHRKIASLWKI